MEIPGAAAQLEAYVAVHTNSLVSSIMDKADRYQHDASDTRLGLPRAPNTSLAKANLSRSAQVLQERRDKKDAVNKLTISITSHVYSQAWDEKKRIYGAMKSVCHVFLSTSYGLRRLQVLTGFIETFQPQVKLDIVVAKLVGTFQALHKEAFPAAELITR
jgi:hypothetical protein